MDNKCYCSHLKTLDKYLILCYNKYRELGTAIINAILPFPNLAYVVGSPYGTNTANCGCRM